MTHHETPEHIESTAYILLSHDGHIISYSQNLFTIFPHLTHDFKIKIYDHPHFTDLIRCNLKRHIYDSIFQKTESTYLKYLTQRIMNTHTTWEEYLENGYIVHYALQTLGDTHKIIAIRTSRNPKHIAHSTLLRMAHYDAHTGLMNARHFQSRLDHLTQAQAYRTPFVLMYIHAQIHHADQQIQCIQNLSKNLRGNVRQGDILAYVSHDTFAIILKNLAHPNAVRDAIERILARLNTTYAENHESLPSISIFCGVVCFPTHGDHAETLIQKANLCLQTAQNNPNTAGHITYRIYDDIAPPKNSVMH